MMRTSPRVTALLATVLFSSADALHIAITGTSQGIGLDAAKRLIRDGHTVYHANRNSARSAEAAQQAGGGVPMVCDLASLDSVRAFADELSTKPLDVLCLNAGIAPSTKAEAPETTADGFESCIGTNHLGHFLLANLLAPQVKRMVVTASSVHDPEQPGGAVGGKGGATLGDLSGLGPLVAGGPTMVDGAIEYDGSKVYKDSKLCNVLFCREAKKRFPEIDVRSLNPGFIPTSGLFRAPREDNFFGATAFAFFAGLAGFAVRNRRPSRRRRGGGVDRFATQVPIDVGGERLAYVATSEDVPRGAYLSAETGSKAATYAEGFDDGLISPEGQNDELAARLWDRSRELVNI